MKSFNEFIKEQVEKISNKKSIVHGEKVDTSPEINKIKSGTYKKGHTKVDGFDIAIENPIGSTRSGTDPDGKEWKTVFKADYGYFKKSVGFDKDHVDVFIKPGYKGGIDTIYVVNQYDSKGKFDEHKVIMGASSDKEAMTIYKSNYESGWTGGKSVVGMSVDNFRTWVTSKEPKKGALKKLKSFSQTTSKE